MGKTKTVVVSGEPEDTKKDKKKKDKGAKKTKVPGLGGGERVAAVEAGPIIKEEDGKPKEKKKEKTRKPKLRSKRYKKAKKKVDKSKTYSLKKAVKLIKDTSYSKFDGSMELHIKVKKAGLRQNIELPHDNGKKKKVEVADEETVKKLEKASGQDGSGQVGKIDFDVLLATKEMMPKIVPFAKLLGPKGLMPNPKDGTLIKDEKEAKKFKGNNIILKTRKKQPVVHTVIGKVNQKQKELVENAEAIIEAIGQRQIEKAYLAATMSPSVRLEV